jgi:hypothetical protein
MPLIVGKITLNCNTHWYIRKLGKFLPSPRYPSDKIHILLDWMVPLMRNVIELLLMGIPSMDQLCKKTEIPL